MCGWIGEWVDNLQLLDDRTGPSVRDDHRQRLLMLRSNVDEMDIQPIDLRHELRQRVQFRFHLAPIVICPPIAREFLHHRARYALRIVRDFPCSDQRVATMRRRRSTSSASGIWIRNGRTSSLMVAACAEAGIRLEAARAAEAARS